MKLLVLIDRYKQVTAVANALHMKQPTISFHMKKMEAEWGVKLFEAKAGRIYLTNAGKILLPYATQISALYSEAESKLTQWRDNERTVLRVGCTDCALTALARSSWLTILKDKIDIQISIHTGEEEALYHQLQTAMLDIVICGQPPRDSFDFHYEKMKSSSLKLIVPSDHALVQAGEFAPHDLYKFSFVDHTEFSLSESIVLWKAQLGWKLDVTAKFESVEMIFSAVHARMGLSILPEVVLPDPAGRVAALDLPGQSAPWNLYGSWRPNYWNPTLLKQIMESALM
ncbi:LysR family transcriptional regulator [Cohnella mopanensis]|uniref:LysR family transcriptional regulator n=1 Tax=Cohnella mopanensis TaxID=2911966 RepID=UPI001EF845EE|nr:LysR family transcriptional regulator [Cohnella mopanensis]